LKEPFQNFSQGPHATLIHHYLGVTQIKINKISVTCHTDVQVVLDEDTSTGK